MEASTVFLPTIATSGSSGKGGVSAKDELGQPLDWKSTRLRSTSNASSASGDDPGSSTKGSGYDKAAANTSSSEEILQMLRASLKATSPFKFMTDLSQLQGQGLGGNTAGSEKTQEVLLQERRKNLKPTGSLRQLAAGDDNTDLHSVISEQTMESYHHGGGQLYNDGEVAVANPVEWLEAKKKNLRPTSLRPLPPSSHGTGTAVAFSEETMDDQRSIGK